jgi:hypothetical protein
MPQESTPFRFFAKTFAWGAIGLGTVIVVAVLLSPPRTAPLAGLAMVSLGDGSFASVPQVTVGGSHSWTPPRERTLWDWLQGRPKPGPFGVSVSPPKLMVWVVRHDGKTVNPRLWSKLRHARLTAGPDTVGAERGVVFRSENHALGAKGMTYWSTHTFNLPIPEEHTKVNEASVTTPYVYGFKFPMFPSGCGPLKLELLGEPPAAEQPSPVLATLELPEPAGLNPRPAWHATPLPATSTVGPHTLTLKGLRRNGHSISGNDPASVRHYFTADLEMTSSGQPVPLHVFRNGPLVDLAGNRYESGYQSGVGLWFGPHHLTLTARVPTPEPLLTASRVESTLIDIAADNVVLSLTQAFELRSGRIRGRLVSVGGRGETLQPDPTPSGTVQWGYHGDMSGSHPGSRKTYEVSRGTHRPHVSGTSPLVELQVKAPLIHTLYSAEGLGPHEWLVVDKVLDDQSRTVPFHDFHNHDVRMVLADPLPDAKSLRLSFEVRDSADFTFVIDPPKTQKK